MKTATMTKRSFIVGLVGIYLSIAGIRMQRQAQAMSLRNER